MIESKQDIEELTQKEKEYFIWINKNLEGDNENSIKVAIEILSRNYTAQTKYHEEMIRLKMIQSSKKKRKKKNKFEFQNISKKKIIFFHKKFKSDKSPRKEQQ
jgi:hypothetical protein